MNHAQELSFTCPNCGRALRFKGPVSAKFGKCPNCRTKIPLSQAGSKADSPSKPALAETVRNFGSPLSDTEAKSGTRPGALESSPGSKQLAVLVLNDRYLLNSCIGKGGFGEVWEAWDQHLERRVAIKLPRFPPSDKKRRERFLREGRAAAQLRHPNIVTVFDTGEANGQQYLAMEFVTGKTLSELPSGQVWDQRQSAEIVSKLARALHYAHEQQVVHRDIKPQNIVLRDDGEAQVLDFGLAKSLADNSDLTIDGSVIGTPAYMSPEQARGELQLVGPATDQYSLGATLYWMITGHALFAGPPAAIVAQVIAVEPPSPHQLNSNLDDRLTAICCKVISKRPEDRYSSCLELAKDLERFISDDLVEARPISTWQLAWRWSMKNRIDASLLVTALTLLGIASSLALIGFCRSTLQLWRANELEEHAQSTLLEIEASKQALQREAERLKANKDRSVHAKRQMAIAQENAEVAQQEHARLVQENAKLQADAQAQLDLIENNQKTVGALASQTNITQTQIAKLNNRPTNWNIVAEREKAREKTYDQAFEAFEKQDYAAATQVLSTIPDLYRDPRWSCLNNRIKSNGHVRSIEFQLDKLLPGSTQVVLNAFDYENRMLIVENRDRESRKVVWLDMDSGKQLKSFSRADGSNVLIPVYDRQRERVFSAINGTISVKTSSGTQLLANLPAIIKGMWLTKRGELAVLAQGELSNTPGKERADFRLQLLTITPEFKVEWDISKTQAFRSTLLRRRESSKEDTYAPVTKLYPNEPSSHYIPFEYYDQGLSQNLFGIVSLDKMQVERLVPVSREDDKARRFIGPPAQTTPIAWDGNQIEKYLGLSDQEISSIEMFALPTELRSDYLTMGETRIHKFDRRFANVTQILMSEKQQAFAILAENSTSLNIVDFGLR